MTNKELEIKGCKIFVCPNLKMIDDKGKELGLREHTIKRANKIAVEYIKKTYGAPRYSSIKSLIPAFIYISSILENDRRIQKDIAKVFGCSTTLITKWYLDIYHELEQELFSENPY